jgi:glucan phosphorylase
MQAKMSTASRCWHTFRFGHTLLKETLEKHPSSLMGKALLAHFALGGRREELKTWFG